MRKNDVRKWIHAILDLLPLIVIPVFMVYSHRHTIDSYSVQAEETKVVDFNQYLLPNEINVSNSGVNSSYKDYHLTVSGTSDDYFSRSNRLINSSLLTTEGHKYFFNFHGRNTTNLDIFVNYNYTSNYYSSNIPFIFTASVTSEVEAFIGVNVLNGITVDIDGYFALYDLTQMFGSGYEPTIDQFNSWYPNNYYDHNTGTKQLLKTGNYITYEDTDIGSQFFYSLYNTVDHYFNFGNVLNFGNIYDWLNVNIFNGTAPLSVYVVWNVFLYEFLMDLIFLLYALFMFFIDMCTNLIERFTCSASGGRLR